MRCKVILLRYDMCGETKEYCFYQTLSINKICKENNSEVYHRTVEGYTVTFFKLIGHIFWVQKAVLKTVFTPVHHSTQQPIPSSIHPWLNF